jgi:hypothetical protein
MSHYRANPTVVLAATIAIIAAGAAFTMVTAQGDTISACVNRNSGEIKISSGGLCTSGDYLLTWGQTGTAGPAGPEGPAGPQGPSGIANVLYFSGGMYPGTSVARAFCPEGTKVMGGGGLSLHQRGLAQSFPIADETGLSAYGSVAVGWQVAADDFSDVQAYVVCVGP